jgi:hypothetical protein
MSDNEHLNHLIARWLAGDADETELQELLEACKSDPQFLATMADLTEIDRLLPLLEDPADVFADELRDRLQDLPDNDRFTDAVTRRIGKGRRPPVLPFIAFIAAAAVTLLFILPPTAEQSTGDEHVEAPAPLPPVHATITTTVAAAWEQGHAPADSGIRPGHYRLLRGLVSMRFDSGVDFIVEGPAEFDVVDGERVILVDGTVTAKVPDGAEGFTVDTSSPRVIDRGTEFAVTTSRTGDTEVHVLDGIVDAHPIATPDDMIRLSENEARVFHKGGLSDATTADPSRFYREMPPAVSDIGWLHWSFDEADGTVAHGNDHGLAGRDVPAVFSTIEKNRNGPRWTEGLFGSAIEFDGTDDYLQTDFEGIGGTDARTVAFWVRVPTDFKKHQGYGIVSWGSYEYEGATWQISPNPVPKEGPLGRLRVGTNKNQVIGTTDLRDGRWHHIAVVMYGGVDANVATHVIMYVDGEFERASRKSVHDIFTDVESESARKVQIGRNSSLSKAGPRCFRGTVDEVYLVNAALSQDQIRKLMANERLK